MLSAIGQIQSTRPDNAHRETPLRPALANARIQNRRFFARISADDQQRIGFFNAGNASVEAIEIRPAAINRRAIFAAVQIGAAISRHQILKRQHAFRIRQRTRHGANPIRRRL